MVTITVIFWGAEIVGYFPFLVTKGMAGTENCKWCLLDSRMCFPVTPLLGACLKLNVAIKEQWQPSKISKSPLMLILRHLFPILICCPPLTNAWRKSVIWNHLVPGISRYHICRVRSLEVNIPLQKAGLGILEESCCTRVIFTPHEICNLKTKAKERRNYDNNFRMPNQLPLWHFSLGSITQSKHGSNIEKFTIKRKWQTHLKFIVCSKWIIPQKSYFLQCFNSYGKSSSSSMQQWYI